MRRILKNVNDPILRKELEAIWDRLNYVETKTVEPTTATLAPGEMAVYNEELYVNDRNNIRRIGLTATGVQDHGDLTGLSDDDHTQYLNEARHDADDHSGLLPIDHGSDVDGLGDDDHTQYFLADGTRVLAGTLSLNDSNTQIWEDGSSNLTFKDAVAGTLTLSELSCPPYIYIKATGQASATDLHLSDGTNWNTSKALIKTIRVITDSTDWDAWLLQNDNGYAVDDATIPMKQIMEGGGDGDTTIWLDLPYQDEDASGEIHLYFVDNSGSETFDIIIQGYKLR